MNTSLKGDKFETKSLEIITAVLEKKQLGIHADYARVYPKKKYFSQLRGKDIVFDLAIELWPPDATTFTTLYLIECKDYKTRVPVNKIEDFHSKITQVAGVNVKGVFITNSPIQEAGYNIAKSVGMMVIYGESSKDYKIVLHKKSSDETSEKGIPFIKDTIDNSKTNDEIRSLENTIDQCLLSAFESVSNESKISNGIDKLSKEQIENIAESELAKIDPAILVHAYGLTPQKLKDYLTKQYKIQFSNISRTSITLGFCDLENNTIGINESVKGTKRELFVLSHEFGHYMLHQKLTIGQEIYDRFSDSEFDFKVGKHRLENDRHWIEWQANYFATALTMPKHRLKARLWRIQDIKGLNRGPIPLNDTNYSQASFYDITEYLSNNFNVTKTSIIYQLKEQGLITNHSRLKSIGELFTEYKDELFL